MSSKSRFRQSARMGRGESMEGGGNDKTLCIFKDGCARGWSSTRAGERQSGVRCVGGRGCCC